MTDDKKKKLTSKFHKATGLAFEHIVKDHFNHRNEELKNMHKQQMIYEIKRRNIAVKKDGLRWQKAYYSKDEK